MDSWSSTTRTETGRGDPDGSRTPSCLTGNRGDSSGGRSGLIIVANVGTRARYAQRLITGDSCPERRGASGVGVYEGKSGDGR